MAAKSSKNPGNGKKIDTVYYDVQQVAVEQGRNGSDLKVYKKIAIDVYLMKSLDTNPESPAPAATKGMAFKVRCEDGNFEAFGTDIDACIKLVRSKLDDAYKIKWENWLLVRVNPERPLRGIGAGLSLSWDDVERGVTVDGSVLMKRYDLYSDFGSRWKVEPWPKTIKENGRVLAVIPATDANKQALEVFFQKIHDLRKAMADLVAPDKIEETLAKIASSQLALIGD